MSKYDPLFHHLSRAKGSVQFSFSELESLLGFPLPRSARRHAAWWSNSGGTHVQAQAWLGAGYRTEDVDVERGTVRFVPEPAGGFGEMKQEHFKSKEAGSEAKPPAETAAKKPGRHPAFGALKGMITLLPDVDYTEPADPDWGKVYED